MRTYTQSPRMQSAHLSLQSYIERLHVPVCMQIVSLAHWFHCDTREQRNLPAIFHRLANTSRQLRRRWIFPAYSDPWTKVPLYITRIFAARNMLCARLGTRGPRNGMLPDDDVMTCALWQIESTTGIVLCTISLGLYAR